MKSGPILFALVMALSVPVFAEQAPAGDPAAKKISPEERKRKFEALKKELEAFKPAPDAERDEVLVYAQQVLDASTKFAKEFSGTVEGFEAAATGALQLAARSHPKSGELAQLALDIAPASGVDSRSVAKCWLLVANANINKGDLPAARAAVEKMKDLAPDLYALASKQLDANETKKKDEKK